MHIFLTIVVSHTVVFVNPKKAPASQRLRHSERLLKLQPGCPSAFNCQYQSLTNLIPAPRGCQTACRDRYICFFLSVGKRTPKKERLDSEGERIRHTSILSYIGSVRSLIYIYANSRPCFSFPRKELIEMLNKACGLRWVQQSRINDKGHVTSCDGPRPMCKATSLVYETLSCWYYIAHYR